MNTFIPNEEQNSCITRVNKFIDDHKPFSKLLINGSAGTGKTTIIISSIVNILIKQIIHNIDIVQGLILDNKDKPKWATLSLNIFIISAPTNKAKDVLVTKYNIYIEEQLAYILDNTIDNLIDTSIKNIYIKSLLNANLVTQIINSKITFLTVSQVLSIGRVINEMGIEEFTKGNDKKITDKYNKGAYLNTSIIVDECSMIDKNTSRLLELIKCPIIYIGDYCQLPPVNEELSTVFAIEDSNNSQCINLKIVERCKNNVTLIANCLRNRIYDNTIQFNLLKHTATDLIIYNKKFSSWLESYINDIKKKQVQLDMNNITKDKITLDQELDPELNTQYKQEICIYDTMALGWTNKCCLYLNKKIRGILFSEVKNIDSHYLIKGDKLLIKTPYYKYDNHIYSSNIMYVSKVDKTQYKPIIFKDWCDIIITLNELQQEKKKNNEVPTGSATLDIDINNILDTEPVALPITTKKNKTNKSNIMNYFKDNNTPNTPNTPNTSTISTEKELKELKEKKTKANQDELQSHRKLFYTKHILADIITSDTYVFTDELSLKYNLIVSGYNLHNIKHINNIIMRISAYTKWHKTVSTILFGIPNDRISCKKCSFFVKKFSDKAIADPNYSNYISDFMNATANLDFEIFLCDLATFTKNGKNISSNIPILDMSKQNNIESLEIIRNIIKNSYEVKLMLSKQDEMELNSINKMIGEDENSVEKTSKYITMSQMFGHYMSHVITSSYLEIDYGYALTVHKSQGSTYDNVYVEYSNILSNIKDLEKHKLLYTAITRCINKLHVYY